MTIEEPKAHNRRKRSAAPTTPDPVEIAMEIAANGQTPADAAMAVLRANAALMHEQIGLARNERFRNRIKAVRDGALAVLALGLVFGAGWVVWDASQANGVVIEPFAVTAALAGEGVTGDLVANRLLTRLAVMQAAAPSNRRSRTTGGVDAGLEVEIPQTGLSLDEALRLLRRRFGRETIVSGEVTTDAAGQPRLIVQVDGLPVALPTPGNGAPEAATLDDLLDRGAEAVFSTTDTYRYGTWLNTVGREEEAVAAFTRLSLRGPAEERAWAMSGLAVLARWAGRSDQAVDLAREAIRLNPDIVNGHGNLAAALYGLGRHEEALRAAEDALKAWRRSGRRQGQSVQATAGPAYLTGVLRGDFAAVIEVSDEITERTAMNADADRTLAGRASALAGLHDIRGARAERARLTTTGQSLDLARFAIHSSETIGDWPELERVLRQTILDGPAEANTDFAVTENRFLRPWLAYALARQERHAEAAAVVADLPVDAYPCLYLRGMVASAARDWRTADRWFAEALRQGPSLPQAEYEWGRSRLARGDREGAIALFRSAHVKGPRWAEPLKVWGDALLAQGDEAGAIRKYQAADDRAPQWGALHLAWGQALEAQGRRDQAREKYSEAARMDLSAADRAEVVRRRGAV